MGVSFVFVCDHHRAAHNRVSLQMRAIEHRTNGVFPDGFYNHIIHAGCEECINFIWQSMGRDPDNRDLLIGARGANEFCRAHPVKVGHRNIHKHGIIALSRGELCSLTAVWCFVDGVAFDFEDLAEDFAVDAIVFGDQNAHRL